MGPCRRRVPYAPSRSGGQQGVRLHCVRTFMARVCATDPWVCAGAIRRTLLPRTDGEVYSCTSKEGGTTEENERVIKDMFERSIAKQVGGGSCG